MATNYVSTHSVQEIDGLQAQINNLQTTISNLNNSLSSNYINKTTLNTLSNTISSIQQEYATKAQINSITLFPSTEYQNLTLTNSAKKTSWTVAISNWQAPSNGWLNVYLDNVSSNPGAFIKGENNEVRQNASASRAFALQMPVVAGKLYEIQYNCCAVSWARFIPAVQFT